MLHFFFWARTTEGSNSIIFEKLTLHTHTHLLDIPFEKFTFCNPFTGLCQRHVNHLARRNVHHGLSRKAISLNTRKFELQNGNSIHVNTVKLKRVSSWNPSNLSKKKDSVVLIPIISNNSINNKRGLTLASALANQKDSEDEAEEEG